MSAMYADYNASSCQRTRAKVRVYVSVSAKSQKRANSVTRRYLDEISPRCAPKGKWVLSNRLYLPKSDISMRDLLSFQHKLPEYEDQVYEGEDGQILTRQVRRMVPHVTYKCRGDRVGIHCGNVAKLMHMFDDANIIDKRASPKMGRKLRMRDGFKPRNNQQDVINTLLELGHGGIIDAPTAWGKTIFSLYLATVLGLRTLVLMTRTNWVSNWVNKAREFTNADILDRRTPDSIPTVGVLTGKTEVYSCINVATIQSFFGPNGKRLRKRLRRKFGLVIMDEAVDLPATETGAAFASFAPRWRLGLSADYRRKDQRHLLAEDLIGPVVANGYTSKKNKLDVELRVHDLDVDAAYVSTSHLYKFWFGPIITRVSKNIERNREIVNNILRDVEAGRKVLVLTLRRDHVSQLGRTLAAMTIEYEVKSRKGKIKRGYRPIKVETLVGGGKKTVAEAKITAAGNGEYDVFIAIEATVGKNTDMPRLDCLHDLMPTTTASLVKQRMGRLMRPHPEKSELGRPMLVHIYPMFVVTEDKTPAGRLLRGHPGAFIKYAKSMCYPVVRPEKVLSPSAARAKKIFSRVNQGRR